MRYGSLKIDSDSDFGDAIRDNKKAVELVLIRGEKRVVNNVKAGDLGLRTAEI